MQWNVYNATRNNAIVRLLREITCKKYLIIDYINSEINAGKYYSKIGNAIDIYDVIRGYVQTHTL